MILGSKRKKLLKTVLFAVLLVVILTYITDTVQTNEDKFTLRPKPNLYSKQVEKTESRKKKVLPVVAQPGEPGLHLNMTAKPRLKIDTIRGQPNNNVRGQPHNNVRGQPNNNVRGQPNNNVRGQPHNNVRGQPNNNVREQPNNNVRGQPNNNVRGQPNSNVKGQPNNHVRGQPNRNVQPPLFIKRLHKSRSKSSYNDGINSENTNLPAYMPYFKNRTKLVDAFDHTFIIPSKACSPTSSPFLVVLCLSKYDHVTSRNAIRQTWGRVSRTKVWPTEANIISDVRLVFLLGRNTFSLAEKAEFTKEDKEHGDIIVSDFFDSYRNLTRKVVVGLKWVETFCERARFVLKVDEDTFIHVANMVAYLKSFNTPDPGVVIGHVYPKPPVMRVGKWSVDKMKYPFNYFPPYVSGNSYVISGNIISPMIDAMMYLPYIFIEDVAITGIARTAINASLVNDPGFTYFARPPPKICDFHNATIKSATKTSDSLKHKIWKALHMTLPECQKLIRRH